MADGLTTHAPRALAASTAPPLPIIIVRTRVSPSPGTRGLSRTVVAIAPGARVHGDDGPLVTFDEEVGRHVVEHAAVARALRRCEAPSR